MALIILLGEMGTGKTLFLVRQAATHPKIKIYSNFSIKLPNVKLVDPEDLLTLKYEQCAVFMDEAYTWLESRVSGSKINRFMSYVLFQSRKRGIDIFLTAQLLSAVDVRFRNLATRLIECERLPKGFRYTVFRSAEEPPAGSLFLPESAARKYYKFYDTAEIVEPFNLKDLWLEIVKHNPAKYNKFINNLAAKYLSERKESKITKASVEDFIVSEGYPKSVTKDLINRIKTKLEVGEEVEN